MKKPSLMIIALITLLGVGVYAAYHSSMVNISQTQPDKISVSASFYPLAYFASEIGGDKAAVLNITPSGAEPHDYEPTIDDIINIQRSKLLILNGAGLESWAENIALNLNREETHIVRAAMDIAEQKLEHNQQHTDPHVWLSPLLAKRMVDTILSGFLEVDPNNADYYNENASVLQRTLDMLDAAYTTGLANCASRDVVTSHAAFGYLTREYNLHQIPIAGLSPNTEPSPKQLAQVATFARTHDVKVIFFEELVSPRLAETIASEIGADIMTLNPLEGLTEEASAAGENYITVMQQNLEHLKNALSCAP